MPDFYNKALIIAREILAKTKHTILFTDIAQLVRDTDSYVVEETDTEIRLVFIVKKDKQ